jgi:hypothetical protein
VRGCTRCTAPRPVGDGHERGGQGQAERAHHGPAPDRRPDHRPPGVFYRGRFSGLGPGGFRRRGGCRPVDGEHNRLVLPGLWRCATCTTPVGTGRSVRGVPYPAAGTAPQAACDTAADPATPGRRSGCPRDGVAVSGWRLLWQTCHSRRLVTTAAAVTTSLTVARSLLVSLSMTVSMTVSMGRWTPARGGPEGDFGRTLPGPRRTRPGTDSRPEQLPLRARRELPDDRSFSGHRSGFPRARKPRPTRRTPGVPSAPPWGEEPPTQRQDTGAFCDFPSLSSLPNPFLRRSHDPVTE